ncbi:MAG: crossover junction endodeoxyribonuclease RuvC [Candidatus Obscuribacterales bacterium]
MDPGTATVGFGVIETEGSDRYSHVASGTIETPRTMTPGERLVMIRRDLLSLLNEYQPHVAAVEAIFFFKNAKTLVPVSQARGVIVEALSSRGLAITDYTPMQVKMCLTGYGKADKKDVQFAVMRLLGLKEIIKPDDASDALAVAVSHARMSVSSLALSRKI